MNNAWLNFLLAVFWLLVGGMLLALDWVSERPGLRIPIGRPGLSMGWPALVLAGYNLLRWWLSRIHASRRQAEEAADQQRKRLARHPRSEPIGDPDPNFLFRDRLPPEEQPPPGR